jgi:cobyric acid synthase
MRGVTILGSGAGAGKSCYSIGVLKLWRDLGRKVEPFKAVTVVNLDDPSCSHPDLWRHGVYHHCSAAGVDGDWTYNPVAVVPDESGRSGELFIKGRSRGTVALAGSDHVDFAAMRAELFAECDRAIKEALDILRSHDSYVVIEGSGGIHQHET